MRPRRVPLLEGRNIILGSGGPQPLLSGRHPRGDFAVLADESQADYVQRIVGDVYDFKVTKGHKSRPA